MTVITQEIQKLEPGGVVELFHLDASAIGGDIMRFHRHANRGSIWWAGQEYLPYPVQAEGFQRTSEKPSVPKLTVANIDGSISELCRRYGDLVGSTLTRYRTLVQYLDAINFTDGDNLLVNGELRDDVSGWTVAGDGVFAWAGTGIAVLKNATSLTRAYQSFPVTPGQQYLVKVRIINRIGASNVRVYDGAGWTLPLGTMNQAGITNYVIVTPTTSVMRVAFEAGSGMELTVATVEAHKYVGNPTANPAEQFTPEIWYVERKAMENETAVQFELASALDLNGVQLPRRQIIANYCLWLSQDGYRGPSCGYTGPPVAKADGTPTSDPAEDQCGGKLSDCKLRLWPDGVLNFGGFPAAALVRM